MKNQISEAKLEKIDNDCITQPLKLHINQTLNSVIALETYQNNCENLSSLTPAQQLSKENSSFRSRRKD